MASRSQKWPHLIKNKIFAKLIYFRVLETMYLCSTLYHKYCIDNAYNANIFQVLVQKRKKLQFFASFFGKNTPLMIPRVSWPHIFCEMATHRHWPNGLPTHALWHPASPHVDPVLSLRHFYGIELTDSFVILIISMKNQTWMTSRLESGLEEDVSTS